MRDTLATFFEHPSADNFLVARQRILQLAGLDQADGIGLLAHCDGLHRAANWQALLDAVDELMPRWALCARLHYWSVDGCQALGRDQDAELEQFLFHTCLEGLLSTGDGSRERPYLTTYPSDPQDVVAVLGQESVRQMLVPQRRRQLDVLTCRDGRELWFDVTDVIRSSGLPTSRQQHRLVN